MSFFLQSRGKAFDDVEELIKFLYEEKDARALLLECMGADSFVRWVLGCGAPGAESVWREDCPDSGDPDIRIASHLYLLELAAPDYRRRVLYICSRLLQQLPEYWLMNHTDCYRTRTSESKELLERCSTFTERTTKSTRDYLTLVTDLKEWQATLEQQMLNCYPLYESNFFVPGDYNLFGVNVNGYFISDQEGRRVPIGYLAGQDTPASRSALQSGIRQHIQDADNALKTTADSATLLKQKGEEMQKSIRQSYPIGGLLSNGFSAMYIILSAMAAMQVIYQFLRGGERSSTATYMMFALLFAAVLCIQSSIRRMMRQKKWQRLGSIIREAGSITRTLEQLIAKIDREAGSWEQKLNLTPKGSYYPPTIHKLSLEMEALEPGLQKKNHTKKCFLLLLMAWFTVMSLSSGALKELLSFLPQDPGSSHDSSETTAEHTLVSYHYTPYEDSVINDLELVPVVSADASSTLVSSRGVSYDAANVTDQDPSTSWQEAADGSGIGEWVQLTFEETVPVSLIRLNLGSWTSSDKYQENCRPSSITLIMESGDQEIGQITQHLDDVMDSHCITFDTPIECSAIRFVIEDVYTGSKYEDTVIADIGIYH